MKGLEYLVDGFAAFRKEHFERDPSLFHALVEKGQNPKVAIVACVDSRVSPTAILNAEPGSLFVIRNVANHVPATNPGRAGNAAVAAIEYAVLALGVDHIIIMGHSHCGGISAVMREMAGEQLGFPYVETWMAGLEHVCKGALRDLKEGRGDARAEARAVEQAAVVASLRNLMAYDWIRERTADGRLLLHGWYFDMTVGELWAYDQEAERYVLLVGAAS